MTLQELYESIDGSYEQAVKVLRVDKLIEKHIKKFADNGVVEKLLEAGETHDPEEMFETAHALKGICGNLGLTKLYELASKLSDEFRPGNERQHSDEEVRATLDEVKAVYDKTTAGIIAYEEAK